MAFAQIMSKLMPRVRQIDYKELVRIMWIDQIGDDPVLRRNPTTCCLDEAIRRALAKWTDRPFEQVCLIIRDRGLKPITTYKAVRKIYDRPDFPKS
ncbi:hypothetical protein [Methylobacterium planeticum]|uniref:Uncharacterized protein n=1 Tax=Methylobacterium planeticum TaxID=2615211 RepID=A0A6N6MU46_9HYPH|nr:hypothetical protein [Methylobacterium planeticum]KAB1075468.1 hypothetical protein F6X51_01915 [Methylobacterium planeticum]